MCIWFGPLSSNYVFTFFNLCTFNFCQSRIQCVVICERNSSSILFRSLGNFADVLYMVLNVHRACGLGMILKLFSTLDISLLAQAKYIGKRNIKKDIRYLV